MELGYFRKLSRFVLRVSQHGTDAALKFVHGGDNNLAPTNGNADSFDRGRESVQVTGINARGVVNFEISVGVPELFVELMPPPPRSTCSASRRT